MDETNFNIHVSRSMGRAQKGSRCTVVAAGSKGANVHLIGCISILGLVYFEIRRGAFKKESAQEWMRTCLRRAMNFHKRPVAMVIDNAPCHSEMEMVFQEPEFENCFLVRLAPYSPMLNPIEHVWSVIKADVKAHLADEINEVLRARPSNLSLSEYRLQALEALIGDSLLKITPELCFCCINKCAEFYPRAARQEPMEF